MTLSVNSSNGFYWVRVGVSVTDPSRIKAVVFTFVELAPSIEPDPADDWAEEEEDSGQYAKKAVHSSVQGTSPEIVEDESVLVDIEPEGPTNGEVKFRYGYTFTWNVAVFEASGSSVRFKNYTATFMLADRGILTEGYHILVEAIDWQGNINSVEKSGAIEKNWLEKVADKLKEFLDIAGAIARAFLSWLIEAVGPIMGFLLMLLYSIARNIVDMIFGIFDLINMLVFHFKDLVQSFGMMFSHMGEVFKGVINQTIDTAETLLPGSWKNDPKPDFDGVAGSLAAFFANPWGFTATNRMYFAIAAVVGSIVGFVLMNFLGGGAAVMGKIKSFTGLAKTTKEMKGVTVAAKAEGRADDVAVGVKSAVRAGERAPSGGELAAIKQVAKKSGEMSDETVQATKDFFKFFGRWKKAGAEVDVGTVKAAKVGPGGRLYAEGLDGGVELKWRPYKNQKEIRTTIPRDPQKFLKQVDENLEARYGSAALQNLDDVERRALRGVEAKAMQLKAEGQVVYRPKAFIGDKGKPGDISGNGPDLIAYNPKTGEYMPWEIKTKAGDGAFDAGQFKHAIDGETQPFNDPWMNKWLQDGEVQDWVDDTGTFRLGSQPYNDFRAGSMRTGVCGVVGDPGSYFTQDVLSATGRGQFIDTHEILSLADSLP